VVEGGGRAGVDADRSWQSYRLLADNAIDVVLEANLQTVIQWISPSVEDVLGWAPGDLVGRPAADVVHPDDIGEIMVLARAIGEKSARVQAARCRMLTKAGPYKPMQLRGRPALDIDGTVVGHVITMQDTSERDDALRALSVLSEGNRVLARVDDEAGLLVQMCEAIVTAGRYPLSWYGRKIHDPGHTIVHAATAGSATGYADAITVTWDEGPFGLGATGTCIRTATAQVRHDFTNDPAFAPWRAAAQAAGLRSSLCLPVVVDGEVDGALMVYATEANAFDLRAQELFETLASDLGLGLDRLRSIRALKEKTLEIEEQRSRIAESEARYRLLAENSSDVVWQAETGGTLMWVSDSVRHVLGWEPEQLIGRGLELLHPDDLESVTDALRLLDQRMTAEGESRIACGDGSWRWMAFNAHRATGPAGLVDVVALRDIDAEVRARNALVHAIGHDPLTGMAARATMVQRLSETLQRLSGRRLAAVLCVGVDRLSSINDAYTHAAGDLVLTTLAARIAESVGNPDLVGRSAGVEFLVLVPDLASGDEATVLAEAILRHVKGDIPVGDQRVEPSVSIGIAIGDRRTDPERLLRDASAAMGQAKADGRDRYSFADASMADQARRRLDVERRLREGLDEDRFIPYFQPVVGLGTGEITGYEALVRYRRADGSIAPPSRFMPIAELSPLVCDIDMTMLRRALATLAVLPDALSVAVNLSTITLTRPGYPQLIEQLIRESEVRPSRLHLEVTETALLGEIAQVVEVMDRVAAIGARWYVDDFGTGYSSISHLRDLPVSGLKLDVTFSTGIRDGNQKSIRLAQALAALAGGLGLDTVAEGIETEDEAALLTAQGWRHGQGWLYGRPVPLP
jgi:diguanylate cyclase (GGDEF)-like protein/PAS domain S-box-containing protein